ncbi:MAG: DUF364 domain-containing protein [Candidatus Lokiarchaeota archaeon]|nr:DUF364 domain-containing protein [Candidatus Lokiarchaeota archaeon]
MMRILEEIIASLEKGVEVREIRRGPLWTAVVSKHCGLASALNEGGCVGGGTSRDAAAYAGIAADELAALSLSDSIPEASLGLAAINSLVDVDPEQCDEGDAAEFILKAGRGKNVSIIGHFPFVDVVREGARNLWVIEKRPQQGDLEEGASETCLPRSDVVVISSTTLINHTLPRLLELCPPGSTKIMLGPTTPMSPILFDHGIDMVSGSVVTDANIVLENVSKGMSFSAMKKFGGIRLVNLVRKK